MTRRLQAISEQLSVVPATFENIPKIRHVAPDSSGRYVCPSFPFISQLQAYTEYNVIEGLKEKSSS